MPSRVNQGATAGTEADVATGLFVASGVVLAASGVALALILTAHDGKPGERQSSLHLQPMLGPGTYGFGFGGSL